MIAWLRQHLAPNRVVVYLVAASALGSALIVPLTDVGAEGAAAIISSVLVFAGVAIKWLSGWQQYERAVYDAGLLEKQRVAAIEVQQERAAQAKSVSRPGSKTGPILPR